MNYPDNHAYIKPPASRPMDMYSVRSTVTNQTGMIADALINLGGVTSDHASRIDELRKDHEDLRALLTWIAEAHPDVVKQYHAVKDIERASK
jgi:hypothetical protein